MLCLSIYRESRRVCFQGERDRVLHDFKEGRVLILVATDVAARGLDVKDIRMVINFDFPNDMEVRIRKAMQAFLKYVAMWLYYFDSFSADGSNFISFEARVSVEISITPPAPPHRFQKAPLLLGFIQQLSGGKVRQLSGTSYKTHTGILL